MATSSPFLTQWTRLVRYVSAQDGKVRYGEPILSGEGKNAGDIDALAQKGTLKVKILEGASPLAAAPTGEEDEVKQLLGPLTPKDVPIIRCTGLNYKTHSEFIYFPNPSPAILNKETRTHLSTVRD